MSLPQQKFREIVFQMLYSYDMGRANDEDMLPLLMAELSVTRQSVRSAQERVHQVIAKQPEIDALIGKTTRSYNFERIQSVERNVLRLGIFEILYDDGIPPKVAIAEALRLARKFGTPESSTYVNALLDNIYKESIGETVDSGKISEVTEKLIESEEIAHKAALEKKEEASDDEEGDGDVSS